MEGEASVPKPVLFACDQAVAGLEVGFVAAEPDWTVEMLMGARASSRAASAAGGLLAPAPLPYCCRSGVVSRVRPLAPRAARRRGHGEEHCG